MSSTVFTLSEYTDELLEAAALALAGTDEGTPELVYSTASRPAYDCCPALIVYVAQIAEAAVSPGFPEASAKRTVIAGLINATYLITVLRCAANPGANGSMPSVDSMIDVAHQTQQDVFALWNGLRNAVRDGDIFERCIGVVFDPARPVTEQGGCVGWEITVRAHVPGYVPSAAVI